MTSPLSPVEHRGVGTQITGNFKVEAEIQITDTWIILALYGNIKKLDSNFLEYIEVSVLYHQDRLGEIISEEHQTVINTNWTLPTP